MGNCDHATPFLLQGSPWSISALQPYYLSNIKHYIYLFINGKQQRKIQTVDTLFTIKELPEVLPE